MQDNGNVSPAKAFFRNKWIRLILVIDAIVVIAIIAITISNATRTATISFNVTPVDSTISVDGHEGGYTNGSYQIHPGNHEVTISHEGLDSKTLSINIEPGHSGAIIAFLSRGSDFDFYNSKSNYESLQKLVEIASQGDNITTDSDVSAEQFLSSYKKNRQLLDSLPVIDVTPSKYGKGAGANYENDTLKIMDGFSLEQCTQALCLHITDTSGQKEDFALSVIKKFGYDPSAYQIIYEQVPYEKN